MKREFSEGNSSYKDTRINIRIIKPPPVLLDPPVETCTFIVGLPLILTKYKGSAWEYKLPSVNNPSNISYSIKTYIEDADFITYEDDITQFEIQEESSSE